MTEVFGRLRKRTESDFLKLIEEQAEKTKEGLEAFESYARSGGPDDARRVVQLEKEEDELRRILIDELNRTFVTPIDREDIFKLSRAIDDVLDYAYSTVDEMTLLEVSPSPYMQKMASVLREAAEELLLACRYLKGRPSVANDHAVRAKTLENIAESLYREALVDLFKQAKNVEEVVYILKMREVYRHLSNAADRGDEAANIIGDIVVKMT